MISFAKYSYYKIISIQQTCIFLSTDSCEHLMNKGIFLDVCMFNLTTVNFNFFPIIVCLSDGFVFT